MKNKSGFWVSQDKSTFDIVKIVDIEFIFRLNLM